MTGDRHLDDFGRAYADAWSSGDPYAVARFFSPSGRIAINDDEPAVGREAIRQVAADYMTSFPDLEVVCDRTVREEGEVRWYWTMKGTNTGRGGTGRTVEISGYEALAFDEDGRILSAHGHFDAAEFDRQIGP